jgi:uncharacterized lipoprotein YajG
MAASHKAHYVMKNTIKYIFILAAVLMSIVSCTTTKSVHQVRPKLSLAQWSFNRELRSGQMSNQDFIRMASELGFDGVEYVNQFFKDKVNDKKFLDSLIVTAKQSHIKNLLIMLDGLGELGSTDANERSAAIINHKQWIDAAQYIGCTAVRINAQGKASAEDVKRACIESINQLLPYAKSKNIHILIENHGGMSNNGDWMVSLMQTLSPLGAYTLPDFNNWCWAHEGGDYYNGRCLQLYDRYKGVDMLLPYARGLSVKAFTFDDQGNEPSIDFYKMMTLAKKHQYQGYLGIEFEGHDLDGKEGVIKTRDLAIRAWQAAK